VTHAGVPPPASGSSWAIVFQAVGHRYPSRPTYSPSVLNIGDHHANP
jgi:hypothetical protein